jgi:hypothetical protein
MWVQFVFGYLLPRQQWFLMLTLQVSAPLGHVLCQPAPEIASIFMQGT